MKRDSRRNKRGFDISGDILYKMQDLLHGKNKKSIFELWSIIID